MGAFKDQLDLLKFGFYKCSRKGSQKLVLPFLVLWQSLLGWHIWYDMLRYDIFMIPYIWFVWQRDAKWSKWKLCPDLKSPILRESCACFFKVSNTIPAVMWPLSGTSHRTKQELVKTYVSHRSFPHLTMSHHVQLICLTRAQRDSQRAFLIHYLYYGFSVGLV